MNGNVSLTSIMATEVGNCSNKEFMLTLSDTHVCNITACRHYDWKSCMDDLMVVVSQIAEMILSMQYHYESISDCSKDDYRKVIIIPLLSCEEQMLVSCRIMWTRRIKCMQDTHSGREGWQACVSVETCTTVAVVCGLQIKRRLRCLPVWAEWV